MRVLLVTAPMVQINTPYPATTVLLGYLRKHHPEITAIQRDPALDLILRLFSKSGLALIKSNLTKTKKSHFFLKNFTKYSATVDDAIAFLQGKNPDLQAKILARKFLPEGPRFSALNNEAAMQENFSSLPEFDQAQHLASLYIDDLADLIRDEIDPRFEFARYAERLAASEKSLSPLLDSLKQPTLIDEILKEVIHTYHQEINPDVVGISSPFAGTVYGAFRIAKVIKDINPNIKIILGGGYPNTELRELSDPRIFNFFDFITLDDGERPLTCILEHLQGKRSLNNLFRTYIHKNESVHFIKDPTEKDIPFQSTNEPSYEGLSMNRYVPLFEMLNPVNRLWTGYRWNKMTLAHGCYWKRCSFCDVSLDYIGRYEPDRIERLVNTMERLAQETGETGFHFVDEAAPPKILKELSQALLERKLDFQWWGNIRFDKSFTPELTNLMSQAGCIAVTGGLEVASDRLLKLINKGVTIEQVAKVTKAFQASGIFVHAYLMYGFPTETTAETVESLEIVRQLFENECLHSAFWHRFAATTHSPIGMNPAQFGITLHPEPAPKQGVFSVNDLPFLDPTPTDHDALGQGLKTALYNYMHGVGLDWDVRDWFSFSVPKPKISRSLIRKTLSS